MGRLFWKFFFFIWLAQLAAILGLSAIFSLERQHDVARWQAMHAQGEIPANALQPPHPPEFIPPPPMEGKRPYPPPPNGWPPHPPAPLPLLPLAVCTLASLIFAALLAWYFAKPIRLLRSALSSAATGNLETRIESVMKRNDELSDLGRDFDRMASQLQSLIDSQHRLLHDVSHELRSPLARLQAATGLLRQQPEKTEFCIERIERESVRMDRLIGELLTLSRLEAGVTGKMDEEIAIDELLADIVEDARFEAETSGRTICLKNPAGTQVCGNHELLHRAIENVVRNAIHHTPEAASVTVESRLLADGRHLLLTIEDEGSGVRESDLENIFEPFFRTGSAVTTEGHGLGLAIARRIAKTHGGGIRAENRATGGLRVELILPIASR